MSIIFGTRAPAGQQVNDRHVRDLAKATERYAVDGTILAVRANVGMGFQPYYTHARSQLETQILIGEQGSMLSFDGRLDNHAELQAMLDIDRENVADSRIVLAAFERWGESCFGRLTGDWALALWSSPESALYLARDHAGTRTLYYECRDDLVLWATYLETFFADTPQRSVDESYIACYLAGYPTQNLTPYEGIIAVPPAHWMRIQGSNIVCRPHWSAMDKEEVLYRSEAQYEEHFFALFKQAVARRTGAGAPILSHLSGGMDSTSIVCMSDYIRAGAGAAAEELLDTVSFYDDSEPSWDERPYFEAVERRRGKRGIHLPLPLISEDLEPAPVRYLWPGADKATYKNERQLIDESGPKGYRVILAGFGGDEFLGGVPNALPELADRLWRGDLTGYVSNAVRWCLVDRSPLLHMTGRVVRFLAEQYLPSRISLGSLPPWSTTRLRRHVRRASKSLEDGAVLSRPSSVAMGRMLPALLETLPHRYAGHFVRYEWRYPYLDRDLVDFLLGVPRNLLIRPGRRRFLMRRALRNIVPGEVLERRRKGARGRSIPLVLRGQEQKVNSSFNSLPRPLADLVDRVRLQSEAAVIMRLGDLTKMHFLIRVFHLQIWMKQADIGTEWNSDSLVEQGSSSAALRGDQALPAEQLL